MHFLKCLCMHLSLLWGYANSDFSFRSEHQKAERDVQGAGGGGFNTNLLSYDNPALNLSSESFNSRQRNDSSFMGSNDFIGKLSFSNTVKGTK